MKILKHNRKRAAAFFAALLAGAVVTGCVKDDIFNTDHPDKARLTVTADWSDRGEGVEKPSSYMVTTTEFSEQATSDTYTLQTLFDPGTYTFRFYNTPEGITVADGKATVDAVPTPEGERGKFVEPMPGWLFTSKASAVLEEEGDHQLTATMSQQMRELNIVLNPVGLGADEITGFEAVLCGVIGEWDTDTGVAVGDSVCVAPVFTKQANGTWTGTVRLFGVQGYKQHFWTKAVADEWTDIFMEDVTYKLYQFNSGDKKDPGLLEIILFVSPQPNPNHLYSLLDPYPHVGTKTGIVYKLINTDSNGRSMNGMVLNLDESSPAFWGHDLETGANSEDDGIYNMAVITAMDGWEADFHHFVWADAKNPQGTSYISGTKGIWYLPARGEIDELFNAYDRDRTAFNQALASAGGTELSDAWYWSSYEMSVLEGRWCTYSLSFQWGLAGRSFRDQPLRARAIMEF